MIAVCSKCHQLFDAGSEEAAYEPDRTCAPCAWWSKCVDASIVHVNDAGGEDAPTYAALLGNVRQWLRAKGTPADDATVHAEAQTFILATHAW